MPTKKPSNPAAKPAARRPAATGRRARAAQPVPAADPAIPTAAPAARTAPDFALDAALLRAFDTNDRINRYLVEHLDDEAWRAAPPGGKGRTIAAIVAHIHNVRLMWLKAADPEGDRPEPLDKDTLTRREAEAALVRSHDALHEVLERALLSGGRVKGFKPDVGGFFAYLVAHDAHHRGQIAMLARQLGRPLPQKAMFGMWEWNSRGADRT